jgi:hypothetical protein
MRSSDAARSFFDARIETSKELVKLDSGNQYIRALLRKGYFNKADFLISLDGSEKGMSEARKLISCAIVLSPETIRNEDLIYWHNDLQSLGMLTEWETLSVGRTAFSDLSVQQ